MKGKTIAFILMAILATAIVAIIGAKSFIRAEKCLCCAECLAAKACPGRVIFRLDAKEPAIIDAQFCHGCGICIKACKGGAITTVL